MTHIERVLKTLNKERNLFQFTNVHTEYLFQFKLQGACLNENEINGNKFGIAP